MARPPLGVVETVFLAHLFAPAGTSVSKGEILKWEIRSWDLELEC